MGNLDVSLERGRGSISGGGAQTSLNPLLGWEMGEKMRFVGETLWGGAWGHGALTPGVWTPVGPQLCWCPSSSSLGAGLWGHLEVRLRPLTWVNRRISPLLAEPTWWGRAGHGAHP